MLGAGGSRAATNTVSAPFASVQILQSTTLALDLVFPGQTISLRHGYGKNTGTWFRDSISRLGFIRRRLKSVFRAAES